MKNRLPKRRYRNSLDFVESGFRACWQNAQDLVLASQKLMENNSHASALSLAVLALEEISKLYAIDGLLFARADDFKTMTFVKALQSHSVKLTILELLPLFIGNLSRTDPRFGSDEKFHAAIVLSLGFLRDDGNAVMAELGGKGFLALDNWKQKGFYVNQTGSGFVAPRQAVEPSFAKAVLKLAWRATSTLDFVLKGGNLEKYIENARGQRERD